MHRLGVTLDYPSTPSLSPRWTQDQSIAFEAARECITDVMAICSAELYREEHQPAPDAERVNVLSAELSSLAAERSALRLDDADRIAAVRATYGARVREYRLQLQIAGSNSLSE